MTRLKRVRSSVLSGIAGARGSDEGPPGRFPPPASDSPSGAGGITDGRENMLECGMKREQLLRQLEVAKKRVVHAQDLFKRQQALMPTFQGTAFESEAQNLLAFLEDYRANKVAELDRLIDLLDGNADQDRAR
jgi:hypothetical protein